VSFLREIVPITRVFRAYSGPRSDVRVASSELQCPHDREGFALGHFQNVVAAGASVAGEYWTQGLSKRELLPGSSLAASVVSDRVSTSQRGNRDRALSVS
jgi:hypothetical protein